MDIPAELGDIPAPGRIVSEQFHPELNLVDWTLSNGARVIYRQSALSRNKVGISGCRAGGFSALDSTDYYNGIFADRVVPGSGAGAFSRDGLRFFLSGSSASALFVGADSRTGIIASAEKEDMETMFRLLYLRWTQPRVDEDYAHLLITIGCCELYQGNAEEARDLFYEADEQFRLLLDEDWSNITNHTSAISGIVTVIDNSLQLHNFENGFAWTERLKELYEDYARLPDADSAFVDKQRARYHIYRAWAQAAMGRSLEAAADYKASLATDYGQTDEGKLEAVDYLMAARRWSEAADNYAVLDSQVAKYNIEMTLNNLPRYLLPKLRANGVSGRGDSAIVIGRQVCLALDSAIVWNRQDRAAEIEQIYNSQRMETELAQQKADAARERFRVTLVLFALVVIAAGVYIQLRLRAAKRLEEANKQLAEASARAEESSRMKTAFIQQISHEIRTPLNTLSGFAQVLTAPGVELDEASREQINEAMVDGTERITGIVNKILALSDVVSTTVLERNDTVPPRQIAIEAASTSGIRRSKRIRFKLEIDPDVDEILLQTNDRAASQVLVLLLENAEKFTGEGKVFLRVSQDADWVRFAVEDTGIGVPPEEAEHIFEQFVQLDEYYEGTGLGLTAARSISHRLGGEVVLDTSYSPGARFVFSLPKNV